ncbi:2-amino-4-hydroxy-6-hydroxymethyldihydropteridine diphosphokinase [Thiolapillus sp.]|uniref:2-amino-4-hydroxy-6- hydroxymethyldihydropteridine diphosphokinase n=1 Tax=Thiolapillus sp. TaxID=2017437 RepID=UPI0025D12224|nr:2-amino-4-hydroxy-6-hydroxymethyldihydropteridine diphosphokinase [Thiolapillus sp.]
MIDAYIGLGSNLDQPVQQILQALDELDCVPESWLVRASSLYASAPMGPQDQPDYVNAVADIRTRLAPLDLLDALQEIEKRHGRIRDRRWGPRTLDLDLLLYGDQIIQDRRLTVPHPGLAQRAFVLKPFEEIAPRLRVPGLDDIAALSAACTDQQVRRIE